MELITNIIMYIGFSGLCTISGYLIAKVRKNANETASVQLGVQALLRDRLLQAYNHASAVGYASISERENFENMWKQYHNLGANGVMDDIRDKFFDLPTEEN